MMAPWEWGNNFKRPAAPALVLDLISLITNPAEKLLQLQKAVPMAKTQSLHQIWHF